MRTFDEWLEYQKVNPALLSSEELREWRSIYEEVRAHQSQESVRVTNTGIDHGDSAYAVAVRDGGNLWLCLRIKRSAKGDCYVCFPLAGAHVNPHASYHRDGRVHHKNHNYAAHVRKKQKPDSSFQGAENILVTPLSATHARGTNSISRPEQFSDVFEIPIECLDSGVTNIGNTFISVDLVEAGGTTLDQPGHAVKLQKRFGGHIPNILVTLWGKTT